MCPIADGGDGTLDCLVEVTEGRFFHDTVIGPFRDQKIKARWGKLGNEHTAVIEMAEASGLRLLNARQYSACKTTTFGVGELILKALDAGFKKIVIGLGGSATNDGGAGCVQALGVHLRDHHGIELDFGGSHLAQLRTIDPSHLDMRVADSTFICLADVNNVLFGPSGASVTFAAQKGATSEEIKMLDEALKHYSDLLLTQVFADVSKLPGGGAAGGLAAGLVAFCNARIASGIDYILDLVGFDELLKECDIALTAEGSLDEQTVRGKGIAGVALRARKFKKPVHAFAGRVRGNRELLCRQLGIEMVHEIAPPSVSDSEAIFRAKELLGAKVREFASGLQ